MFYFAWIEDGSVAFGPEHHRVDEDVFKATIEHAEGEFATLTIEIRNPKIGVLNPSRPQWAWLSEEKDGTVYPLFRGRVSSVPADMDREVITLELMARPVDFTSQKTAVAETLKVAPYYDPVWIPADHLDDPDAVLEGRSALWHIDRTSNEVSVSDYNIGEGSTYSLGTGDIDNDTLSVSFGSLPTDRIKMTAKVSWDQTCKRDIDISSVITQGFAAAGSIHGRISSYTGGGLQSDWPLEGDDIGGDWSYGPCTFTLLSGKTVANSYIDSCIEPTEDSLVNPVTARFYLWSFSQQTIVRMDTSRSRSETISFEATAQVQSFKSTEESDVLELSYDSERISEDVDGDGSIPIGALSRRSYFATDRGRRSIDFLMCVIRANFMKNARAVEVEFTSDFDLLRDITLRDNVQIAHPNLPGGSVSGKVISYRLEIDGDSGSMEASVRIGCTIGSGVDLTGASAGEGVYGDDYDDGYEEVDGEVVEPIAGAINYAPPVITFGTDGTVTDDNIDLATVGPSDIVQSFVVTNGPNTQAALLRAGSDTLENLVAALKDKYTFCELTLVPLNTGPFDNEFPMVVEPFAVPKTFDLGAS